MLNHGNMTHMPAPRLTDVKRVPETFGHEKSPGEIGVDMILNKKVFKWHQDRFEPLHGFGMSQSLHEYLKQNDVQYVYIHETDSVLGIDSYEEEVSSRSDRFVSQQPDENQMVFRPTHP